MNEIDMYAIGYLTSSVPAVHEGLRKHGSLSVLLMMILSNYVEENFKIEQTTTTFSLSSIFTATARKTPEKCLYVFCYCIIDFFSILLPFSP